MTPRRIIYLIVHLSVSGWHNLAVLGSRKRITKDIARLWPPPRQPTVWQGWFPATPARPCTDLTVLRYTVLGPQYGPNGPKVYSPDGSTDLTVLRCTDGSTAVRT